MTKNINHINQRLIWNFEFSSKKIISLSEINCIPDELKWEIRFFWPEDRIITLCNIDNSLLDISNYKLKQKDDEYYLLPDCNYNIKFRHNQLIYKPVIKQSTNILGFGPKINLEQIKQTANRTNPDLLNLDQMLQQIQKKGEKVRVQKESFTYKFATTPSVKLELSRIKVNNMVFFSACIEGKSLYLVETIKDYLLDKQVSCDYVTFLKNIKKL